MRIYITAVHAAKECNHTTFRFNRVRDTAEFNTKKAFGMVMFIPNEVFIQGAFFIYLLDIQTNSNWKMWLCVKTHWLLVWCSTATWIYILLHDVCLYLGVWLWHGISMNGGKMKSECFWGDDCYARTSGCLNRFGFRCFLQWEHPTVFNSVTTENNCCFFCWYVTRLLLSSEIRMWCLHAPMEKWDSEK